MMDSELNLKQTLAPETRRTEASQLLLSAPEGDRSTMTPQKLNVNPSLARD